MKIVFVLMTTLAMFSLHCGGDKTPPQDPSSTTAPPLDADGGAAPSSPITPK